MIVAWHDVILQLMLVTWIGYLVASTVILSELRTKWQHFLILLFLIVLMGVWIAIIAATLAGTGANV